MQQQDHGSIRRAGFAVKHLDPVSFNATDRSQRNLGNLSHRFLPWHVGLREIKQSHLATQRIKTTKG
jgi:hypothetical protein